MKINIFNKQKKFEEEVLSGEYAVGDMEYSSYYKDSFKRLKKNKMSMFCLFVILLLILIAIFAPLLAPYDPTVQDYASISAASCNGCLYFGGLHVVGAF